MELDNVTGAGRQLPPVPLEPLAGDDPDRVGDFRLLGRLGAGGMGVAYLAAGPTQDWVVVKTVWKHLASDRSYRARLSRELDAMGRASGAHTASLLDSDVQADPPWFAMEFIPGMTLTRRVDDSGALPMSEVVALAAALVDVLVSVHGAGIVHRDLKPSNIMLSPSGPKLIDFGIADMSEGTQLTKTGMVLGSTGWLAPEQVRSDPVTAATDIHAWALCVLYAATGAPPFGADNSTATIYKVLESSPTVPNTVPEPLHNLLVAALTKEPSHRPTLERLQIELIPGTPPVIVPPRAPRNPITTKTTTPPATTPVLAATPEQVVHSPVPPPISLPAFTTVRPAATPAELRQQAVAEALRRDPSLEANTKPETLARLATAVAAIQEELQLIADVHALREAEAADQAFLLAQEGARVREKREQARLQSLADAGIEDEVRGRLGAEVSDIGQRTTETQYIRDRDRGPVRAFVRDFVDSRHSISEYFLIVIGSVFALVVGLGVWADVSNSSNFLIVSPTGGTEDQREWHNERLNYLSLALLLFIALTIVDTVIVVVQMHLRMKTNFPDGSDRKGITAYALKRLFVHRRFRYPKPRVSAHDMLTTPVASTQVAAPRPPDEPAGSSRSNHRNRNMLIVGGLVLVLVAGVVLSEVIPTGDRAGTNGTSCADGGACAPGDIGPGGGLVFYDAGSAQSWGQYLEMAPKTWSGGSEDPFQAWCNTNTIINGTSKKTIGTGAENTVLMDRECTSGAGQSAADYAGGGKSDWFLPSKLELNEMYGYKNLIVDTATYGFASDVYWSSSQFLADGAWLQGFVDGGDYYGSKNNTLGVRPIRAF